MRDPYEALGVKQDASAAEIKKAYRRLAKRYHPDSTGGDKAKEDRFKEVSTAYDIVGDPEKRARYDAMRRQGAFGGMGGGDGGGIDLGEILAQMFGAGAPGGPRPGGPGGVRYRVYNTPGGFNAPGGGFRETVFGEGGFGPESPFDFHEPIPPRRRSRTHQPAERKVRASDGSLVTQRGNDVHSNVRLTLDQAVLGAVVEVPTLSGRASVKIPPGTSSGVKLRLKGKGAEDGHGQRGDHLVTVHIDVPKQVDDEAKRLLVAFMARAGSRRGGDRQ